MTAAATILRSFKFRLYPTAEQAARLAGWCGAVRAVYNCALQQRQWYGRAAGTDPFGRDSRFNAFRQSGEIKTFRAAFDWAADAPADAFSFALRDLDRAFERFFSGAGGYPDRRRRDQNDSFTLPAFKSRGGGDWRMNVVFGQHAVKLPKIGRVDYVKHKKIIGSAKTVTVIRDRDRWHICVACEIAVAAPRPAGAAIGVDVGVAVPFMTSEGEALPFRATPLKLTKRQKRAQRAVSRSRKGSRRRRAKVAALGKITRKIAARRNGQLHSLTSDLARRFGVVAVEDLRVKNMTASAAGTVDDPGRNVAAKAGLNRAILDVAPHAFRRLLTYKVAARGGVVAAVDPKNTSRRCAVCGHTDADNRRSQAVFACVNCGHEDNADVNAAKNILRAGLASLSATVSGRRKAPSEPRRRSATPKPSVSPQRAGQVPVFSSVAGVENPAVSTSCSGIRSG